MNTPGENSLPREPGLPPDDELGEPLGPQFAELLAAYDELLAIGAGGEADNDPATIVDAEFSEAKECLELLEQVWPRAGENRGVRCQVSGVSQGTEKPDAGGSTNEPSPVYLGQFEIVRELGRGGGGIVFLAIDSSLGRQVALKVPYPDVLVRRELRQRFVQEAQAAAKLNHPNIIPVHAAGEIGPICYIASAYCAGPTLAAWLKERETPVPFFVAAEFVATLADAVEHAHSHGILHRDLKPSNVLLEGEGVRCQVTGDRSSREPGAGSKEPELAELNSPLINPQSEIRNPQSYAPVPKLTDFGLAKLQEVERDATRTGAVLGTPNYMAPEQADGRLADIGVATDVYGLGVILYELVAGRPPFRADSDLETLRQISRDDPPLPRQFRRRVPRDLEAICLKCLEKNPSHRYARAADLAADLHRYLEGAPTIARPVGWSGRAVRWARRRPGVAGAIAVGLLTLSAAVFGLGWHRSSIAHLNARATERIQRQTERERARQRREDYAVHIHDAYQAWQSTDLKSARQLLDRCRPKPGEDDLRGFEWYYVRRLCAGGIVTLRGHVGPVMGAAFAPDGERLVSCGADGTLRLWDAVRGTEIETISAHEGAANAVAWNPDGRLIATVGDDEAVRIWDTAIWNVRNKITADSGKLLCVAFSPDGQHVGAAGKEGVIRVWDATTGQQLRTIHGHTGPIHSLAFSPDGNRLASGSEDGTARIWATGTGKQLVVMEPGAPVVCVAFSLDGQSLATADSMIRFWDLSGRPTARMNSHGNQLRSIAFSSDGRTLASAADDMTVQIWDVGSTFTADRDALVLNAKGKVLHTFRGHLNSVFDVSFSPQSNRLASAGREGTIQIWDASRPQDRQPLTMESRAPNGFGVEFSPDRSSLAVAAPNENGSRVLIWTLNDGKPAMAIPVPGEVVLPSIAFSRDGGTFAVATLEGLILEYDLARGEMRTIASGFTDYFSCAFSSDATRLAVTGYKWNSARILNRATGKLLANVPGQRAVAFSPDGRILAAESSEVGEFYSVELWDVAAERSVGRLVGHKGQIDSIVFSADGRMLATGSADGTARLWNIADRTVRHVMRSLREGVNDVAFLLDEKSLATASIDGTVTTWDVATGHQLLSLNVHGYVTGLAVSADGRTLATASKHADGSRRVDLWIAPAE